MPYILGLMLLSTIAGAEPKAVTDAPCLPLTFAVVQGQMSGDTTLSKWIGAGIAFDLEKRLGRWTCLEPADRLQLARAAEHVPADDARAVAKAISTQLDADFVVTLAVACLNDKIKLDATVWTKAGSRHETICLHGSRAGLFDLQDSLIDGVVSVLRRLLPSLTDLDPQSAARMHVRSGVSVEAYGETILGMSALHESRLLEARSHLQEALRLDPKQWWAHYFLGAVNFHECQFREAADECRTAISIDPDMYAGVYANLAYCCDGLGDTAQSQSAAKEFEKRVGKPLPVRSLPGMR